MSWDKICDIIEPIAPNTANAIRQGNNELALALCKYLGIDENKCSGEEVEKLFDDPSFISRVMKFEEINFPQYKQPVYQPDLSNIDNDDSCKGICLDYIYLKVQVILAFIATFAFFSIVGYVIAFGLADLSKEGAFIVGNLTGIAGAIAKDVFGYFFGSSLGSKEKSNIINEQHKVNLRR